MKANALTSTPKPTTASANAVLMGALLARTSARYPEGRPARGIREMVKLCSGCSGGEKQMAHPGKGSAPLLNEPTRRG